MRIKNSFLGIMGFCCIFYQSAAFSAPIIKAPGIATFKLDEIQSFIQRHSSDSFDYIVIKGDKKQTSQDTDIEKVLNIKLSLRKQDVLKEGDTFEYGAIALHDHKYNATYDLTMTSKYDDIVEKWTSPSGSFRITKITKVKWYFYRVSGEFNLRFVLMPTLDNDFISTGHFSVIVSARKTPIALNPSR
ncbi:MAG TPA: hypothetical protein ACFYDZ_10400 [Candidatus Brocadiaceae bacterium]